MANRIGLAATSRPIAGAVALILFTIAATAFGHVDRPRTAATTGPALAQRLLVFKDRADGAVLVYDADNGPERLVEVVTGPRGFLRGVLRGFARERRARGLSDDQPFRLAALRSGRLVLTDPATGITTDLEAFGPDNKRQFARFLPHRSS